MKLNLALAQKLLKLINGEKIPASKLKHSVIDDLIKEGILHKPRKRNSIIQLANLQQLEIYLKNSFSINNLVKYVETLQKENVTRTELVISTNDSKAKALRSFKGFLVNCYQPINAILNNESIIIFPQQGSFTFIYDFENFEVENNITIVGVENPTNFRFIEKQQYLFSDIKPLFVSRYPQNQSKDLMKWLQQIPNNYLHFGDFDFAGINIYVNEFKKHLDGRASFFIPNNVEELVKRFGNKDRYNEQKLNFNITKLNEEKALELIQFINQFKKGLDQEILIK